MPEGGQFAMPALPYEALGDVIKYMFYTSTMPAETHYRSCDALLSLQRRTDPVLFEKACKTAIEHERYSYNFIKSLVESKCAGMSQAQLPPPPLHENIRGKSQFN